MRECDFLRAYSFYAVFGYAQEGHTKYNSECIHTRSHAGLLEAVDGCGALRQVQADERRDRVHRVDDQADGVICHVVLEIYELKMGLGICKVGMV